MNGRVTKRISSFDQLKVDVFQAIKRAYMRKGVLPLPEKNNHSTKSKIRQVPAMTDISDEPDESMDPRGPSEVMETESSKKDEHEEKAEKGPEEMIDLAERTHDMLYEATSVFPFNFFPDTVTLDREKLTIAERFFWRVAKITSVPVSEIMTTQANVGPFFGSLHIVFSFFVDNERDVKFLWREDAQELQKLLQGYIIAHKRKINTTNLSTKELKILLKDIGQGVPD